MAVSLDALTHFFDTVFFNVQWSLSPADCVAFKDQLGMLTYGEMTKNSVEMLLDWIALSDQDVFYDLGCGIGRVVAHVYLRTNVKAIYGIEIAESRYNQAQRMLASLEDSPHFCTGRPVEIRKGNIAETNCADATVVYMCSTCFPSTLMTTIVENLQRDASVGLRVISLKKFTNPGRFRLLGQKDLEMSWSKKSPVYLYQLEQEIQESDSDASHHEDLSLLATDEDSWDSIDIDFDSLDFEDTDDGEGS